MIYDKNTTRDKAFGRYFFVMCLIFILCTVAIQCTGQSLNNFSNTNYLTKGVVYADDNNSDAINLSVSEQNNYYFIQITRYNNDEIICEKSGLKVILTNNGSIQLKSYGVNSNNGKIDFKIEQKDLPLFKNFDVLCLEFYPVFQKYDVDGNDVNTVGVYKYSKSIIPNYIRNNIK